MVYTPALIFSFLFNWFTIPIKIKKLEKIDYNMCLYYVPFQIIKKK